MATKDHHVDPGAHWSREPDFVDSWPVHCRVGTEGEAFHPNLDPQPFDAIFLKGEHAAAYSGFEGAPRRAIRWPTGCAATRSPASTCAASPPTTASGPPRSTPSREGFETTVLPDLCAGVAPETTQAALAAMREAGVSVAGD